MSRSAQDDQVTSRTAQRVEAQDLSTFLERYRPMLRLLSGPDLIWLSHQRYPKVGHFRRERAAIYFQYLAGLCQDLRALPLWTAPSDSEAFIEMDKASWIMQKMLVKLALAGLLYYFGIRRRESDLVERCFEKLGNLLSAAA